jgi:hypothetical protein
MKNGCTKMPALSPPSRSQPASRIQSHLLVQRVKSLSRHSTFQAKIAANGTYAELLP